VTAARSRRVATLLLVIITAIWGSTFFLIRDVVLELSPADFLAVRFTIAAVAMMAVFWRPMVALNKRELKIGVGLGILYAIAQILQTVGLAHTEASRSGFITGTYVVLTPVLTAILLRERIPRSTWFAVLMATAGLATLSLNGLGFGFGEGVTALAAAFYALHIIGLGRYSSPASAAGLSTVQMIVIAGVSLVAAAPGGDQPPKGSRRVGVGAVHGADRRCRGDLGTDVGPVPSARHACRDRDDPRTGVCGRFRRGMGRRVTDHPDVSGRSHGPCRDVHRGAHRPPL
jgi:drug/metabolite transporter (DMT)-like permease